MQSAAHQEKHFQQYIIDRLVEQGWKLGDSKFYDTERAVYPEDLKQVEAEIAALLAEVASE